MLGLVAVVAAGLMSVRPASANGNHGMNRPQLLPYDPATAWAATVVASDGLARFSVLTDRLIRMEYARVKGQFEDRASLAVLQRNTTTPPFTHDEKDGVLTISTEEVILKYSVGKGMTRIL
jgi:hypothetical protein